jgi:hypothetical protein
MKQNKLHVAKSHKRIFRVLFNFHPESKFIGNKLFENQAEDTNVATLKLAASKIAVRVGTKT